MNHVNVSVILPVFNPKNFEDNIVRNIFEQSLPHFRVILINDDHGPDAENLISRLKAENNLREDKVKLILLKTEKRASGPATARNMGLKEVKYGYLAFLDCDDRWHPEFLEVMSKTLFGSSSPFLLAGYSFKKQHKETKVILPPTYGRNELLQTNLLSMPCVMLNLNLLKLKMFPIIGHEDYGFWLLNLGRDSSFSFVRRELVVINKRAGSLSSDEKRSANWHWRILKAEGLSPIATIVLFLTYVVNAVLKRREGIYRPLLLPKKVTKLLIL